MSFRYMLVIEGYIISHAVEKGPSELMGGMVIEYKSYLKSVPLA